jgi:putative cell wall-binding protein
VGNTVIEVGAANAILLFDQPVILTLPGVTGTVGYKPAGSDSWVQITQLAGGTYANPAAPAFPGEAYISNGTDTKIITWHFTSFAGLSAQNVPSAGSSGNSGGSSPSPEENTDAASRLSGQNRYQTARRIAEQYCQGFTANVVLASGNGFADALSAGVLAHQLDAPILLVDSTAEGSTEALDYMDKHLEKTGTVTIIGGESAVGAALKDQLNRMGYTRINQIGGQDRYDTANRLYQELDVVKGTPVVISSGEDYPDALAISSFAAYNEWPVLLVRKDELPEAVRQLLLAGQPSNIYLTGGTGAIASDVEKQIQSILPKAEIVRFAGQDRWDTAARIAQTFAPNSQNIYLASGYGFADALAGSVLAAKKGDPIILVNPDLTEVSSSTGSYLNNLPGSEIKITAFGGPAVISDTVFKKIREILNHKP